MLSPVGSQSDGRSPAKIPARCSTGLPQDAVNESRLSPRKEPQRELRSRRTRSTASESDSDRKNLSVFSGIPSGKFEGSSLIANVEGELASSRGSRRGKTSEGEAQPGESAEKGATTGALCSKSCNDMDSAILTEMPSTSSETFEDPNLPKHEEAVENEDTCPDSFADDVNLQSTANFSHQTKIQERRMARNVEDFKLPSDVLKMKEELKLKHFFKCMLRDCTFTTDYRNAFISHLIDYHGGKTMYCSFCFSEFVSVAGLIDHLHSHSRRNFQCSVCFYRACSKAHVQVHIKCKHPEENAVVYKCIMHSSTEGKKDDEDNKGENKKDVGQMTLPYKCNISECNFETYDPKDFKKHNENIHRDISTFYCYYCEAQFVSLERLMNHYHFHGINNYQCTYCVHGTDTKDEILVHLSEHHADDPFQIYVRAMKAEELPDKDIMTFEVDSIKTDFLTANSSKNITSPCQMKAHNGEGDPEKCSGNEEDPEKQCGSSEDDDVIFLQVEKPNPAVKLVGPLCSAEKLPNDIGDYSCPFCGHKYQRRISMKNHIYMELEYKRFCCVHCDIKFCSHRDTKQHFLAEHPGEDIKVELYLDKLIERKVKHYLVCLRNMGGTEKALKEKAPLFCNDCGKTFPSACRWHEHLQLCLIELYNKKVREHLKCLLCNSTFHQEDMLKTHYSSMHGDNQLCYEEKPNRMEWMKETTLCVRLQFLDQAIENFMKHYSGKVLADILAWKRDFKPQTKVYKCFHCSFSSNFKFSVERHLSSSHPDVPIKIENSTNP